MTDTDLNNIQKQSIPYNELKTEAFPYFELNKDILKQPLNTIKTRWYQVDLVGKSRKSELLYRFIADSNKRALIYLLDTLTASFTGSIKRKWMAFISKYVIDKFELYKVPDDILDKYNLNKTSDLELFYNGGRG